MVHSFAVIRGKFVTVHHDEKSDRVGIILDVKGDSALVFLSRSHQPTEKQYVPCTKALLNGIPGDQWQQGRPMVLTVMQNADGQLIDTITVLFDKEDNPLSHLAGGN
jgi:hypothetical protein